MALCTWSLEGGDDLVDENLTEDCTKVEDPITQDMFNRKVSGLEDLEADFEEKI